MSVELNEASIAVIGVARLVLRKKGYPTNADEGQLYEAMTHAEDALFRVLNVAHNTCGVPMTYEQLHGYSEPRPEPTSSSVDENLDPEDVIA